MVIEYESTDIIRDLLKYMSRINYLVKCYMCGIDFTCNNSCMENTRKCLCDKCYSASYGRIRKECSIRTIPEAVAEEL